MNRFVVISGCSGGGQSSLVAELGRRGRTILEEPGRRIAASLRRVIAMAEADVAATD
jgi:predicted ATPase